MNDLDLCLEVVSKSCQPLRHIRRWISRKPSEIEAWLGSKGLPIGNGTWVSNDRVTDDVTWTQRCCEAVRSAILATAWLRVNTDVATWRQPHVEQVGRFSQVSVSDWRSKSWACHRAARYHIAVTMLLSHATALYIQTTHTWQPAAKSISETYCNSKRLSAVTRILIKLFRSVNHDVKRFASFWSLHYKRSVSDKVWEIYHPI